MGDFGDFVLRNLFRLRTLVLACQFAKDFNVFSDISGLLTTP